ncbi:DMT family transporter [Halopenitus sp. H-Gu1]|uniref:DMT family transporter n=1 Tax=Halopenitus sp. H-Gu1 TaxID=3242697 RepID=UPI00359D48B5
MSRYRDVASFFLLTLLWGGSFVAIEVGLEFYPSVLFAAYRFDVAAVILVAYAIGYKGGSLPRTRDDLLAIAYSGGLAVGVNNAALFIGQQHTTSGIAAVTYSLVPIATAAIATLVVSDATIDGRDLTGIALAFLGVAIVAQPDPANLSSGVSLGVSIILVGVLSIAIGSVGLQKHQPTFSSMTLTAWAMLFGTVVLHVFSLLRGETQMAPSVDPVAIGVLVFLGVFSSAMAYIIYFTLLSRLGAFQINLNSYVVPVVATVTGWALLGETITAWTVIGFVGIVFGFVLVKRHAIRQELPGIRAAISGRS